MNKYKRKLYRIKELKQSGLSYIEIGKKISGVKEAKPKVVVKEKVSTATASKVSTLSSKKNNIINILINLIKKFYAKLFKKKKEN